MLREHFVISHPVHAAQVCTVLFAAAEQQEQSLCDLSELALAASPPGSEHFSHSTNP